MKLSGKWVTIGEIIAIVVLYIGFRLVTQAGQTGVLIQNDGYAVSGGLLILAAGILIGLLIRNKSK